MKHKFIGIAAMLGLVVGAVALAQSGTVNDENTNGSTDANSPAMVRAQKREELKTLQEEKKVNQEEIKSERQETKGLVKQQREQDREQRCQNIEKRVETRLNRYENSRNRHQKIFQGLQERLSDMIVNFEKQGMDVAKLKADLAEVKKLADKLLADHDGFVQELSDTKTFACGKSEGEFKNQLGEARRLSPVVKADIEAIRAYYQTTVRPDVLALREQMTSGDKE